MALWGLGFYNSGSVASLYYLEDWIRRCRFAGIPLTGDIGGFYGFDQSICSCQISQSRDATNGPK